MPEKRTEADDLDARPVRRTFTAEFKAKILDEYDAAPDAAARGAILRRERLYGSHILDWRKARDAGAAAGLLDRRQSADRTRKSAETAELARLRRQNARLNPYSEAWFKTLKYAPVFPDRFASLADARAFMNDFVTWYNHAHRHSGIGLHTPADVHHGRHHQVRAVREDTLAAARAAHPERFGAPHPLPKILDLPDQVWINRPDQEPEPAPQAA